MTFLLSPERSQEAKLCEEEGRGERALQAHRAANENVPRDLLTPFYDKKRRGCWNPEKEGIKERESATLVKTGRPTLFGTPETSVGTTVRDRVLRQERDGGQL